MFFGKSCAILRIYGDIAELFYHQIALCLYFIFIFSRDKVQTHSLALYLFHLIFARKTTFLWQSYFKKVVFRVKSHQLNTCVSAVG